MERMWIQDKPLGKYETICNECNGEGLSVKKVALCEKCRGAGKLDWIEVITGNRRYDYRLKLKNKTNTRIVIKDIGIYFTSKSIEIDIRNIFDFVKKSAVESSHDLKNAISIGKIELIIRKVE